jgi:hypothetical protein
MNVHVKLLQNLSLINQMVSYAVVMSFNKGNNVENLDELFTDELYWSISYKL